MISTRRLAVAAAASVVVATVFVGGAAVATWSAPGSGVGAAASGSAGPITLAAATGSADLVPGSSASVRTTATNSTAAEVRIGSLELDLAQGAGGFAVDASHASCPTSSFSYATQTNAGAGWVVAPGSSLPITLPTAITMTASAPNDCQGAVVTVYLRVAS